MDYSPLRCVFVTFKVSFERTLRKAETHKGEYSIIYLKAGGAQEKFVDKDWIRSGKVFSLNSLASKEKIMARDNNLVSSVDPRELNVPRLFL